MKFSNVIELTGAFLTIAMLCAISFTLGYTWDAGETPTAQDRHEKIQQIWDEQESAAAEARSAAEQAALDAVWALEEAAETAFEAEVRVAVEAADRAAEEAVQALERAIEQAAQVDPPQDTVERVLMSSPGHDVEVLLGTGMAMSTEPLPWSITETESGRVYLNVDGRRIRGEAKPAHYGESVYHFPPRPGHRVMYCSYINHDEEPRLLKLQ